MFGAKMFFHALMRSGHQYVAISILFCSINLPPGKLFVRLSSAFGRWAPPRPSTKRFVFVVYCVWSMGASAPIDQTLRFRRRTKISDEIFLTKNFSTKIFRRKIFGRKNFGCAERLVDDQGTPPKKNADGFFFDDDNGSSSMTTMDLRR